MWPPYTIRALGLWWEARPWSPSMTGNSVMWPSSTPPRSTSYLKETISWEPLRKCPTQRPTSVRLTPFQQRHSLIEHSRHHSNPRIFVDPFWNRLLRTGRRNSCKSCCSSRAYSNVQPDTIHDFLRTLAESTTKSPCTKNKAKFHKLIVRLLKKPWIRGSG